MDSGSCYSLCTGCVYFADVNDTGFLLCRYWSVYAFVNVTDWCFLVYCYGGQARFTDVNDFSFLLSGVLV